MIWGILYALGALRIVVLAVRSYHDLSEGYRIDPTEYTRVVTVVVFWPVFAAVAAIRGVWAFLSRGEIPP